MCLTGWQPKILSDSITGEGGWAGAHRQVGKKLSPRDIFRDAYPVIRVWKWKSAAESLGKSRGGELSSRKHTSTFIYLCRLFQPLPAMAAFSKKEEEGLSSYYNNKTTVIQEARVFNESPISPRKCRALLTRIVYLLYIGENFGTQEATTLFFGTTKLFQHKDVRD